MLKKRKKSRPICKNDYTDEKRYNMLKGKEKNDAIKTNDTNRGNKSEGPCERKED